MNIHHQSGSILMLTCMMLVLILGGMQLLMRSRIINAAFTKTMMQRQQARSLAWSGVAYAQALLEFSPTDEPEKKKNGSATTATSWQQKILAPLLPLFHRWHQIELPAADSNTSIRICISPENGKININQAFDFKQGTFKKEYEYLLKGLEIPSKLAPGELFDKISEYLKQRNRTLDDITELYEIEELRNLKIFYEPPPQSNEESREIKLADIFTIWSDREQINPLFLSDALCTLLMIRRPRTEDSQAKAEAFKNIVDVFQEDTPHGWEEEWELLQELYDEKPKLWHELERLFSKQFGTPTYSVVSCGKVGDVEERILVILRPEKLSSAHFQQQTGDKEEKTSSGNDAHDAKLADKHQTSNDRVIYKVVKVYFL